MATVHLYISEAQEEQLKRIHAKTGLKRPAILTLALREYFDRMFPEPAPHTSRTARTPQATTTATDDDGPG